MWSKRGITEPDYGDEVGRALSSAEVKGVCRERNEVLFVYIYRGTETTSGSVFSFIASAGEKQRSALAFHNCVLFFFFFFGLVITKFKRYYVCINYYLIGIRLTINFEFHHFEQ
ncbi:hypothetical protein LOK49_LG08G03149 [Camellia lanceoleosa]|uniref:Uncharacterized protein n=1 Tax=Camellia lanceoleosa TaxID=1840588 RepID=A0ACC0GSH3_9ERIC|nr:hypothetical protein LOK49_LG08G03149 [Camellia lanceoleosa]